MNRSPYEGSSNGSKGFVRRYHSKATGAGQVWKVRVSGGVVIQEVVYVDENRE